ncbi:hypothetical protein BN961_01287 [Afipia felis]|uniref:Uncharacterized protein n=1 Tax=Afipia felis TaxID=1035 RepID=A0A090MKE6_AFIFE|nr:hypothetical protein BN961_01287 [Afipia felis]
MQIFRLFVAMLARAIGRDVRHRTRTIERDQRDDVLETVRAHVDKRAPHALTFNLEHADHVATRQHLVGFLVVERQVRQIDMDVALLQQFHRDIEHRQRLEAEEVEFHKPRGLDPFHVELGHRHVGFRIAIHRHEFGQRAVADHDARRVGRGVPRQTFKTLGDVEGTRHHWVLIAERLQFRLARDGSGERHGCGRILRHQLGELVDLAIGHLQHTADVAQHAARLQGAEGDDLADLIATIALLHVVDHLAAAILTEVDVEVRHRHALGIEKAFEQQAEAQRIEVGDGQRIGHQRARAGAAPRPDRNTLRLRPLDEVGYDQEVARIFHPLDDIEFEGEAVVIVLFGLPFREPVLLDPVRQPLLGLPLQLGRLGGGRVLVMFATDGKVRQDRLTRFGAERAALRDLNRGRQRLGKIGEQHGHLGAGLEAMVRRQVRALRLRDQPPARDTQKRIVGFVIVGGSEIRLVGRDQRQALAVGNVDQRALNAPFAVEPMTLQFDIEPVAEQAYQFLHPLERKLRLLGGERLRHRPFRSAGQRDQATGIILKPFRLDVGNLLPGHVEEGARIQPHQAAITLLARSEHYDASRSERLRVARIRIDVAEIDCERTADDRLNADAREFLGELQHAEHVVAVGQRQCRLVIGLRKLGELGNLHRALQQRVSRVDVKMDKSGRSHPGRLSRAGELKRVAGGDSLPQRCRPLPSLSTRNHILAGAIIPFPSLRPHPGSQIVLQLRNEVRPHRHGSHKQHQRGQCGGFLEEHLQHDRLLDPRKCPESLVGTYGEQCSISVLSSRRTEA